MKLEILGVDDTLKFIGRSVTERVDEIATIYEEEARKATPIRSGRARRSWTKVRRAKRRTQKL